MTTQIWKQATAVQLLAVQTAEDGATVQVLFRVTNRKVFARLLIKAMQSVPREASFDFRVQKQYFLDEAGMPTFSWMMLVWGASSEEDWIEDALTFLEGQFGQPSTDARPPASVIQRSATVPAATPTVSDEDVVVIPIVTERPVVRNLRSKEVYSADGSYAFTEWRAPLPQRRGLRNDVDASARPPRTMTDRGTRPKVWVDSGSITPPGLIFRKDGGGL